MAASGSIIAANAMVKALCRDDEASAEGLIEALERLDARLGPGGRAAAAEGIRRKGSSSTVVSSAAAVLGARLTGRLSEGLCLAAGQELPGWNEENHFSIDTSSYFTKGSTDLWSGAMCNQTARS